MITTQPIDDEEKFVGIFYGETELVGAKIVDTSTDADHNEDLYFVIQDDAGLYGLMLWGIEDAITRHWGGAKTMEEIFHFLSAHKTIRRAD